MANADEVRRRLKEFTKSPNPSVLGTVKSVDATEKTCVLFDDDTGIEFEDVRLRPVVKGTSGIIPYPKVGSWVLALRIEDDEDFVAVVFEEITKWEMTIGTASWILEDGKLTAATGNTSLESTTTGWKTVNGQSSFNQTANGFEIKKGEASLKDIVQLLIEAVQQIVVIQGTGPNLGKLTQAMTKLNQLLQ